MLIERKRRGDGGVLEEGVFIERGMERERKRWVSKDIARRGIGTAQRYRRAWEQRSNEGARSLQFLGTQGID